MTRVERTRVLFLYALTALLTMTEPAKALEAAEVIDLPTGNFLMGSDTGPADERPAHRVHIEGFAIDRRPVSNAEFSAFLNVGLFSMAGIWWLYDSRDGDAGIRRQSGKWHALPHFKDLPVTEVSWRGAHQYCAWRGVRLPTEAEWEFAFSINYDGGRALVGKPPKKAGIVHAKGVDLVLEEALWEWVSSAYRPYPYSATDGREEGWLFTTRATRGGASRGQPSASLLRQRGKNVSREAIAGHHNIGFRCVR